MVNMKTVFQKKRIVVTGGTGSFGKMFVSKLLEYQPAEVTVFSRDENKQGTMERELNGKNIRYVLGDVRDYQSIRSAMRGADIVVHAAALKWIPQVEYNVWQGVQTNVVGVQNIIEAARDEGVEKVVALSTDKAVDPINAYGMTKALQERLITTANLGFHKTNVTFVSTRYGNVLGSRGSVVPLFRSLIDANKPITVTDPLMTRFVMTLQDSVALVLEALTKGVGGEVFVKKMPAHTVADIIDVMLEGVPENKRNVRITGIRPGEKIHEVLISESESLRAVEMDDYYVILPQITLPAITKRYGNMKRIGPLLYASNTTDRISKAALKKMIAQEGLL